MDAESTTAVTAATAAPTTAAMATTAFAVDTTATVEVPVPVPATPPMGAGTIVVLSTVIAVALKVIIDVLKASSAKLDAHARKVAFLVTTLAAAGIFAVNQFVAGTSVEQTVLLTSSAYWALIVDAGMQLLMKRKKT